MLRKSTVSLFIGILVLAAALRFSGIGYGLPLRLIADEPQFVLTAITMARTPTLLLSSLPPRFSALLYNPPYPVYVLLFPFFLLTRMANVVDVIPYAFIFGRLMSVGIGLLSVWMVFKAATRMFPRAAPAVPLLAAYLFATSMLSVAIFATVRHWSWATFLVAGGLLVLTNAKRSGQNRLAITVILAGIAMGVNQAAGIILMLSAVLWLLYVEQGNVRSLISSRSVYVAAGIGVCFTLLPFLLHPDSLRGVSQEQWPILSESIVPLIGNLFAAPFRFFNSLAQSEPVLVLFAVTGLAFLYVKTRRLFWFCLAIIAGYIAMFHFLYFFEHRFLSLLLPLLAILGACGARSLWYAVPKPWARALIVLLLAVPLIASVRFSYLLARNDSRSIAREWFEDHIPARSRVMTWVPLMRLSATPRSITEKMKITGERDTDENLEYRLPNQTWGRAAFHALNLPIIKNTDFFSGLIPYVCAHGYEYLIAETDGLGTSPESIRVKELISGAKTLASFGAGEKQYSVTRTYFSAPPWRLFTLPMFGPHIDIYQLERTTLCGKDTVTLPVPAPSQILYDTSDTVPKRESRSFPFTLNESTVLHINLTAHEGKNNEATIVVLTEDALKKMSHGEARIPVIMHVTADETTVPLSPGSYALAIIAPDQDFSFTLTLTAE